MSDKKQRGIHVSARSEEIIAPPSSSSDDPATLDDVTESVMLASLAGEVAELRLAVAIIVEWLQTFEQRLADED
jgi:hypothetical protein